MGQLVYIRDKEYKEMIIREEKINEFVNSAVREKLDKEINK